MTIHLHFFGEPFIEKDGERIGVSLKKAEVVLFYLAMEGFVSRSRLTSLFWGDKSENQAANNLRNTIYLLRKSFPENVSVERKHLCLRGFTSDLQRIPDLLDAERPIDPCFFDEPMQGFDLLELPELDEWLLASRSAIKRDLVEKLRQRISTCYEAGLQEPLVDSLTALLRLEPYEEDSVLELIDALCKMGSVAKAVSTFVAFRDRLKADIGVAPSERAEAFWGRLVASEGISRDLERPGEFFCCREREIGRFLECVPADGRRSLTAFIHGEAGVGKTALANRLVELLSAPGVEVFTARPHTVGDKYPYSAWNGIVSEIGRRLEEREIPVEESVRSVLSGVFYDFPRKNNTSYTIDMELTSERSPYTIGRMLAGLVGEVAEPASGGTTIFVFEDLHWFDPSSLALLEAFFSEASYPFILIATARPECAESGAELLHGIRPRTKGDFLQMQLAPFDRQETMRLCRATLPQEVVERRGEEYFVKKSEGMPLLLVEMLRILSDNPDADCSAGLKGVILSRVGGVSNLQRDILTALSAFGGGASAEDIARVVERDVQEIAAPLEDLLNRKMVFERTDGERTLIDFSHSNVRDCIYEAMPDFKRREFHRRIADAMRAHYSPQTWNPALSNLLCHHYRMADMRAEELKQHLQEMTFHITLNHDLFPLVRDRTLLSCSIPFSGREETEHRIDIVRDLLHEINATGPEGNIENKRMEASYLEIWGGYLVNWGEYQEGRIFIDRALRLSKEYGFDEVRLHCLEHIGHHFLQTDNAAQLLPAGREILYLARGIDKENHMGIALRFIGMSMLLQHDFARAERVFWRSIRLFEELAVTGINYTLNLLAPRCYIGEMRQWTGDLGTALSHFEYCVERCEKAGLFWGRSHFHAHAADVAIDMGDWDLMYRHIDTGHALFESCRGGRCGSLLYSLKAIGDARRGKFAEALDAFKKGEILSAIGKSTWQAAQLFASAWLARLMEEKKIPAETFAEALPHPAPHYADAAERLYRKIGAEKRADFIAHNFA